MKLNRKKLLYDIANLAYTIADTGENNRHTLHRVRDICQDGNIDRVNSVIDLAYSKVMTVLKVRLRIPPEIKLHLKEAVHEYLVCCVLADWLAITLPEAADVWKFRAEACFDAIKEIVSSILTNSSTRGFRRRLSPF